ncbi:hypothetical protein B0H34DRAFT_673083 [Crassisporium funariophilum]|nr:hypothetical protein B0H34DRAFT_673083 [Crassisporium funariophilum]
MIILSESWLTCAFVIRIELQNCVLHLGSHPHEGDQQVIERQQNALGLTLVKLHNLHNTAGAVELGNVVDGDESQYDETVEEHQAIPLPSTGSALPNAPAVEIRYCKKQASLHPTYHFSIPMLCRKLPAKVFKPRHRKELRPFTMTWFYKHGYILVSKANWWFWDAIATFSTKSDPHKGRPQG